MEVSPLCNPYTKRARRNTETGYEDEVRQGNIMTANTEKYKLHFCRTDESFEDRKKCR